MQKYVIQKLIMALVCGLLFGFGLALAGMTNPQKVLGFLDITGNWDASLMLVLGGAVAVTAICFFRILKLPAPVFEPHFHLPQKKRIDISLITGSILFGIGWGISGYCPGPALALLASPNREALIFLPALITGWLVQSTYTRLKKTG